MILVSYVQKLSEQEVFYISPDIIVNKARHHRPVLMFKHFLAVNGIDYVRSKYQQL